MTQIPLAFVLEKQRRVMLREGLCLKAERLQEKLQSQVYGLGGGCQLAPFIAFWVQRGKADRLSHQCVMSWQNQWLTSHVRRGRTSL